VTQSGKMLEICQNFLLLSDSSELKRYRGTFANKKIEKTISVSSHLSLEIDEAIWMDG